MRRRKKALLAKAAASDQEPADTQPTPFFQSKPELDAEQQRHEMEGDKQRFELEGQGSRQEMTAQQTDGDKVGRCRVPQEFRGVEPSYELDVE